MANADAPFGLLPIGKVGQNRDAQGLSEYSIAANASAIFQNDPVQALNTGPSRMSSWDSAKASDQRNPCNAKNRMQSVYWPKSAYFTSSHVKNFRGETMIFGPEIPCAGDVSTTPRAWASLKTLLMTAKVIAAVCGGSPRNEPCISLRVIDSMDNFPNEGVTWQLTIERYVERVFARIGRSPMTWRAKVSKIINSPREDRSDVSAVLGVR